MAVPDGWNELLGELEPYLSPDWMRNANEHADQGWVRLILLVDAHAQLATPRIAEKIGQTMSELAEGRETEQAGWTRLKEAARDRRHEVVVRLMDAAPEMLPQELVPLFVRSVEPTGLL
jgi:hypothetical protein